MMPSTTDVVISTTYLNLFSPSKMKTFSEEAINVPEIAFNEISFPVENKIIPRKVIVSKIPKPSPRIIKPVVIARNELPFNEPVVLEAVYMSNQLPENLVSLYREYSFEMVASTDQIQDEVSTKLAVSAEPEFFSYDESPVKKESTEVPEAITEVINDVENVQDVKNNKMADYQEMEEVAVEDLVAFDYSKAQGDLKAQSIPVISTVTGQAVSEMVAQPNSQQQNFRKPNILNSQNATPSPNDGDKGDDKKGIIPPPPEEEVRTYSNRVTIQLGGTNFKKTTNEVGFELRFQDDLNETIQDYNSGAISLEQELAEPKMTRSLTVLKRGFVPTNTDLILEEGTAELTIPAIEEQAFNEMMAPFESRGPIGAVLVELDENSEDASLDVPYSQVLKLRENLQITEGDDFLYQLFVGVKAGNALLTYKNSNQEKVSKIIHIHEREVTFEANIFEFVKDEKVKLLEEDLLSKEKTPLIISSEEVKLFATAKTAPKINNHTHQTDFKKVVLGGRRYLELTHQSEPVFVGLRENATLEVPSENYMRHILSRFEGSNLGNRCLVQVNLKKKAMKVDVGSESVAASLMTHTQILDTDGKFYDSVGEKSHKIIVVGENQGAPELGHDAKINLKITYQDGSVQYLGSYCSPNTYLVEQL
jgi:hypothetical protein